MKGAGDARMAAKKQCADNHLAPNRCGERGSLYLALLNAVLFRFLFMVLLSLNWTEKLWAFHAVLL